MIEESLEMLNEKKIVIITSPGRTGTKYFGEVLGNVFENCYSMHEPDVLNTKLIDTLKKIRTFGFNNMILSRLLQTRGVRILSEKRIANECEDEIIIKRLKKLRFKFYSSIEQDLIIESYYAWYGLLDLLPRIFPNIKIVSIVRDPREWVRSNMNWGTQFGFRDTVTKLGFKRINPKRINDKRFKGNWEQLELFEKLAWQWNLIAENLLRIDYHYARLFKYENIFFDESKSSLKDMMNFIGTWEDKVFRFDNSKLNLKQRIHKNVSYSYPEWKTWTSEQAIIIDRYCGKTMKELGYGMEEEWRAKLK